MVTFDPAMLKIIFLVLVFYCLFKLVFDFIIPVSKATAQIRTKVREMNEHPPGGPASQPQAPVQPKAEAKDYIDFEEIKEKKD